jgi:hypothetical protein
VVTLPDSTVVTQYRLDKVGRRWCRQDDITLSDRQVGRERTPTAVLGGSGAAMSCARGRS